MKKPFNQMQMNINLIKIKRFYTMDLPVIEVLEGEGRLKGTFGAFVVKYKNNTVKQLK